MSGSFCVCVELMCGICAKLTPIMTIADKSLRFLPYSTVKILKRARRSG